MKKDIIIEKTNLFLDFDGTIINSIKAYCETYNELYRLHPKFEFANWRNCEKYNFSDVCPLEKNPSRIFSNELFFKKCDFINTNTRKIIKELNKKYKIFICSIGIPLNISKKILWIKENLPFIKNYIMIINENCETGKSIINMENSIFIDDVADNLFSSNAKHKICFGNKYDWNKEWKGDRCFNWTNVKELLL